MGIVQNLVLHLINLAIIVTLLYFLMYKPVRKYMQKRSERVANEMDEAARLNKQAQGLKIQYEAMLADAHNEAEQMVGEALQKANAAAQQILQDAQKNADVLIESAREQIDGECKNALEKTHKELARAALDLSEKILDREVSEADNQNIIENFFQDAG